MTAEAVSIIIPAYNEEAALAQDVEDLMEAMGETDREWEIIIVDDGSTDGTATVGHSYEEKYENVRFLSHPYNMGGGASRNTGIKASQYDLVAVVDGDGTYPVKDMPRLVDAMEGYDMVVGARNKEAGTLKFLRVPAKFFIRKLAGFMSGRKIPDLNSGMRVMRKDVFYRYMSILPQGHSWVSTITLSMLSNGNPVKYMEIDYFPRKGKSSFHPLKDTASYLSLVFRTITWFNPLRIFMPLAFLIFAIALGKLIYDIFWLVHVTSTSVLLMLGTLQIFVLGLLADLIAKRGRI